MDKEQIARHLPQLLEDILRTAKKINRSDGIIVLLCLEDAYENLGIESLGDIMRPVFGVGATTEMEMIAVHRHALQMLYLIEEAFRIIQVEGLQQSLS